MDYLIELARSQAAKDMEKKVGKATTIAAGVGAAGAFGMGLRRMMKGKGLKRMKPRLKPNPKHPAVAKTGKGSPIY